MPRKQQEVAKHTVPTMAGRLWSISCKVRGLGELIGHQDGEPALRQAEANLGIGELLVSLADDVDKIREEIESR